MTKLSLITAALLSLTSVNAFAGTVLTCTQNGDATKETLVLTTSDVNSAVLEVIDPTALQPVAHLNLWANTVNQAGRIISVDHWESMIGAVQLIAVFDAGAFKSKHVYFDASFGRDEDNHGSYGLEKLNQLSAAGLKWICVD